MNGFIVYDSEQRQCEYIAKELSASTRVPYANVEDVVELVKVEALIVVKKAKYNNGTSDELIQLVTNVEMPSVKMALIVHVRSTLLGQYYGHYYNSNSGSYISRLNMPNAFSKTSRLHQTLHRKGVGVVDDCLCDYSPFLLGRVSSDSMMRTVRFVREALGMGCYG